MHRFTPLALAALLLVLPAGAAGLAAGMCKNVKGSVTLERDGKAQPLAPGAAIMSADRIITGADGSAGIALRDDTLLSVGPNSKVSLDKFVFDDSSHDGEMSASVKRGTMAVISGKLAKKSPGAVKFVTPSAILGVRGTQFVIDVGGGENQ